MRRCVDGTCLASISKGCGVGTSASFYSFFFSSVTTTWRLLSDTWFTWSQDYVVHIQTSDLSVSGYWLPNTNTLKLTHNLSIYE